MISKTTLTIDNNYDLKLKTNLERRLNRPAKPSELINSDNDSDLVIETLWQIIVELEERIKNLEVKLNRDIIK